MIRLDKYCSSLGLGSRQIIDQYCRKGLISINNNIVKRADIKITWGDVITINYGNEPLSIECKEYVTVMLNKPKGYVCSDIDEGGHKSYSNLLQKCPYRKTLHVAGRLDQDTTGLVICTSDGDLNHRIISPKHKLIKTYIVTCEQEVNNNMISSLEDGVMLDDGYRTLPAKVEKTQNSNIIQLSIYEGKYHQVKRMLEAVGNKVTALHRSTIGDWNSNNLKEGEWKYLY